MTTCSGLARFICKACGTQFPQSEEAPASCPICEDDRQYVPRSGQEWTTLEKLRIGHRNSFREYEPNLIGIGPTPDFAIGQRALLFRTAEGNFLWDCVSLIDDATIEIIRALGGLRGIAISHPHYYTTMLEWSRAFGDVPIHLHAADRKWVMRSGDAINFWESNRHELAPGVSLIHCGGHFPGGTILHWESAADGHGALLTGDIVAVTPDGWVTFMHSYPNAIPLPASSIRGIRDAVKDFAYDRIYGAFWDRVISTGGQAVLAKSVERYLRAIAPDR